MSRDQTDNDFLPNLQEVKVYSPAENLIGTVTDGCGIIRAKYLIIDALLPDAPLFQMRGPVCTCSCMCEEVEFPIYETGRSKGDGKQIGVISKSWGGFVRELFSDSDSFGVTFPAELDTKYKALFLAACIFIVSITFFVILVQACKH